MLHACTFRGSGFTDCENMSIYTCGGALDGFIFESSFQHYTRFNVFVTVLSFLLLNLAKD